MLRSSSSRSESSDLFAFMGNCDVREGKGAERFTKAVWGGIVEPPQLAGKDDDNSGTRRQSRECCYRNKRKGAAIQRVDVDDMGKTSGNRIII